MDETSHQPDGLDEFVRRYTNFAHYPGRGTVAGVGLINPRLIRHYTTEVLKHRADVKKLSLFVDNSEQKVAFREVNSEGKISKWNCLDDDQLELFLSHGPTGPKNIEVVERADPPCRFVFLLHTDPGQPLQISQTSLLRLLTFHQVSPSFVDILYAYRSAWAVEQELRSTAFRTLPVPVDPPTATVIPSLSRTGRRYQMSFDLKIPMTRKWKRRSFYKVRQVAIHHQLDIGSGVQLWIVGDPQGMIKDRVQRYLPMKGHTATFGDVPSSFQSSLEIHLEILGLTVQEWSQYVKDLDEDMESLTEIILRERDQKFSFFRLPPVAHIQELVDQASKVLVMLSSNRRMVEQLEDFYTEMIDDTYLGVKLRGDLGHSLIQFRAELRDLRLQHEMHLDLVRGLRDKAEGRKAIVTQRWQNDQALMNNKEAVMMRIITVITLIYLPPTFSSTFFSMEMFKNADVSLWSKVCFPLLAVTMILAYLGRQRAMKRAKKEHKWLQREPESGDSHLGRLKGHLWATLTSWRGSDESGRAERDIGRGLGLKRRFWEWITGHRRGGSRQPDLEADSKADFS